MLSIFGAWSCADGAEDKNHPCGSNTWKVLRIGIDFKLECTTCGRIIMIPRLEVIKKAKEVIENGTINKSVIKND